MNVTEGARRERFGIEHPKRQKADGPGHGNNEANPRCRGHGLMGRTPTHHHGHHKGRPAANAQQRREST